MKNPSVSERQRLFMCSDYGRLKRGKRTKTGMSREQLRDYCRKNVPGMMDVVCAWCEKEGVPCVLKRVPGDERYVSHGICKKHEKKLLQEIEEMRIKRNPITHKQAYAVTKKLVKYAKQLYRHEQAGVRKHLHNPDREWHEQRFLEYMWELEKYKIGSPSYNKILGKAYAHLEAAKAEEKESHHPNPRVNANREFIQRSIITYFKKEGQRVYAAGQLSWPNYVAWMTMVNKKVRRMSNQQLVKEFEDLFGE